MTIKKDRSYGFRILSEKSVLNWTPDCLSWRNSGCQLLIAKLRLLHGRSTLLNDKFKSLQIFQSVFAISRFALNNKEQFLTDYRTRE